MNAGFRTCEWSFDSFTPSLARVHSISKDRCIARGRRYNLHRYLITVCAHQYWLPGNHRVELEPDLGSVECTCAASPVAVLVEHSKHRVPDVVGGFPHRRDQYQSTRTWRN